VLVSHDPFGGAARPADRGDSQRPPVDPPGHPGLNSASLRPGPAARSSAQRAAGSGRGQRHAVGGETGFDDGRQLLRHRIE
jgi:hypothetical protein